MDTGEIQFMEVYEEKFFGLEPVQHMSATSYLFFQGYKYLPMVSKVTAQDCVSQS